MHEPTPSGLRDKLDDPLLREMFPESFVALHSALDRYTTWTGVQILRQLDLTDALAGEPDVAALLARRGLHPQGRVPLEWLRRKLLWEERLQPKNAWSWEKGPLIDDGAAIFAEIAEKHPAALPAFKMLDRLAANAGNYYRDGQPGEEILFAPAALSLWLEYFSNENPLYAPNNRMGADRVLAAMKAQPQRAAWRILEIGGGAGSAAAALFAAAAQTGTLERIARYEFTEVVPTFLRRAERALVGAYGSRVEMGFAKLDLNLPFDAQGIAPGSVDLVYLVNVLHIAVDLPATLREIGAALAPEGVLVFAECIRPLAGQPIYPEFVVDHLENFRSVRTDPHLRPTHGFLTPRNWHDLLAVAGFNAASIYPDLDRLNAGTPFFFLGAITAARGK